MRYISTRGNAPALNFEDVLLTGLASDGGLYVPENLPRFTVEEIASWAGLPYHELAFNVMRPFVDGCIEDDEFKAILKETYAVFEHPARSEEHTSELQSRGHLVCRLLLEKKKPKNAETLVQTQCTK